MLQCVAVCCTVLQCVAVCRAPRKDEQDEVQCVAVCCSVLQYVAHLRKMSKMRGANSLEGRCTYMRG